MDSEVQALYDFFDSQVSHDEYNPDIVKWYLDAINKPLLTSEEEIKLMERIKLGDKKARKIFIERNLRLVVFVAKRYTNRGLELMDIIEEGNLGLINAVNNYSIEKNVRFSTYAVPAIERSIQRGIENKARNIRIPIPQYKKLYTYINASNKLASILSAEPTTSEIAVYLNITIEEAEKLEYLKRDMAINISELKASEDSDDFYDRRNTPVYEMSDNDSISTLMLNKELNNIFERARLTEKEISVLEYRFGMNNKRKSTLDETAKIFNLTRQRISQIEHDALEKIKSCKKTESLAIYTENPDYSVKKLKAFRRKKAKIKNNTKR